MTIEELESLLESGEQKHVEFKAAAAFEAYDQKIVKAAMAFANNRDGGVLIIGIDDTGQIQGLTDEQLATYDADTIRERVNTYAEPFVSLDVRRVVHPGGTCVCIVVDEFASIPILCKKDGAKLRQGAIYVRSGRKPESAEVRNPIDLRDVLDLATHKEVRRILAMTGPLGPSDNEQFMQQLAAQDQGELVQELESRGYYQFFLYPARFNAERFEFGSLEEMLRRATMYLRRNDFPVWWTFPIERGQDWIGQNQSVFDAPFFWRMWQSGLFVYTRGIETDWPHPEERVLGVGFAIYLISHALEFAARLTEGEDVYRDGFVIEHRFVDLQGRSLETRRQGFAPLRSRREASLPEWRLRREYRALPDPRAEAQQAAAELFARFGWTAAPLVLDAWLDEVGPR